LITQIVNRAAGRMITEYLLRLGIAALASSAAAKAFQRR
jgi:hypothetical protein